MKNILHTQPPHVSDEVLNELQEIVNKHSLKPKDVLTTVRQIESNKTCYYCHIEGANCCQMTITRPICNHCAVEHKKNNENIKSILFDKIDRLELLRILLAGKLADRGMDQKGIERNLEILLRRCDNLEQFEKDSQETNNTNSRSNLSKTNDFDGRSNTSVCTEPLKHHKMSEQKPGPTRSGKIGALSIESLKNKRAQIENVTVREEPQRVEQRIEKRVEQSVDQNIRYISLDRPMSVYKYKGTGDVGLVHKEKSVDKRSELQTMSYSNLRFVKQERKTRTEIFKEKSKSMVDGILARFKRNNI